MLLLHVFTGFDHYIMQKVRSWSNEMRFYLDKRTDKMSNVQYIHVFVYNSCCNNVVLNGFI